MKTATSRRRFLRNAGLSAAAVTFGPSVLPFSELLRAAGAQEVELTNAELLAFAESAELAAAELYGALRGRVTRPPAVAAATTCGRHHQDHANAIGPLAGDKRTGKANIVLRRTLDDHLAAARNEDEVIKVAYDLENGLASTYLWIIDLADDPGALRMAASIEPVEGQHAVTWGRMINKPAKELTAPDTDRKGFETEGNRLDIAEFPTMITTSTSVAAQ